MVDRDTARMLKGAAVVLLFLVMLAWGAFLVWARKASGDSTTVAFGIIGALFLIAWLIDRRSARTRAPEPHSGSEAQAPGLVIDHHPPSATGAKREGPARLPSE